MEMAADTSELGKRELGLMRTLFIVAAIWNFAGAIPGLTDTVAMFEREFGSALTNPVMIAIYRGAWGTAFLYGIGFLLVAYNPVRHTGIVMIGGLGKALFALNLLFMFLNGWTSNFAMVVILGDVVFVMLMLAYFWRLKKLGHKLI
ncbi:hypothetical protein [Maritalea sp. S77]|uniref:hypothetical protein n=1 Tax=Maritalea sp. S77 TaxID=3415125 RepID=UPI003C7B176C